MMQEVIVWEIQRKDAISDKMMERIIDIAGIAVTVISIAVTLIGIVQSVRKDKHQKSDRSHQD